MALFAIQLVRVVISSVVEPQAGQTPPSLLIAYDFVIIIHQTLNVIIISVHFYFFCFTDDQGGTEIAKIARGRQIF